MRQSLREITVGSELGAVLEESQVCHLALNRPGQAPYLVALSFGYDYSPATGSLTLWFHCADEGYKLELLEADDKVGFQLECKVAVRRGSDELACDWGMQFESIVGEGRLNLVDDAGQRLYGLRRLTAHYGAAGLGMPEEALRRTAVLRLDATGFTAKRSRGLWPQLV